MKTRPEIDNTGKCTLVIFLLRFFLYFFSIPSTNIFFSLHTSPEKLFKYKDGYWHSYCSTVTATKEKHIDSTSILIYEVCFLKQFIYLLMFFREHKKKEIYIFVKIPPEENCRQRRRQNCLFYEQKNKAKSPGIKNICQQLLRGVSSECRF